MPRPRLRMMMHAMRAWLFAISVQGRMNGLSDTFDRRDTVQHACHTRCHNEGGGSANHLHRLCHVVDVGYRSPAQLGTLVDGTWCSPLVGAALRAARNRRGARVAPEAPQRISTASRQPCAPIRPPRAKTRGKVHISASATETDCEERTAVS